jgi:hypothetical protein
LGVLVVSEMRVSSAATGATPALAHGRADAKCPAAWRVGVNLRLFATEIVFT